MLNVILEWLKSLIKKMNFKDYIILLLTIFTLIFYFQYRHYYHESLTPIVVVDNDSVDYYKNKAKEEYIAKNIYVQTIEQLKESNNELSIELKKLKDDPIVITKTLVEVKVDSIPMQSDTIFINHLDSIQKLTWHNYNEMFNKQKNLCLRKCLLLLILLQAKQKSQKSFIMKQKTLMMFSNAQISTHTK